MVKNNIQNIVNVINFSIEDTNVVTASVENICVQGGNDWNEPWYENTICLQFHNEKGLCSSVQMLNLDMVSKLKNEGVVTKKEAWKIINEVSSFANDRI